MAAHPVVAKRVDGGRPTVAGPYGAGEGSGASEDRGDEVIYERRTRGTSASSTLSPSVVRRSSVCLDL